MKYIIPYDLLLEKVEDDNLLMEIVHVLSQRIIESIIIEYYKVLEDGKNIKELYDILTISKSFRMITTDSPKHAIINLFGMHDRNIKKHLKKFKQYKILNYKPRFNKMSNKAYNLLLDMLEFCYTSRGNYFFNINLANTTRSANASYKPQYSEIDLYITKEDLDMFIKSYNENGVKFLNRGIIISNKIKSAFFHEVRHWFDDYKSKTKAIPKAENIVTVKDLETFAEYMSQPHEISAWVSQFIQEVKNGMNKFANVNNVTFDSEWEELDEVLNKHFRIKYVKYDPKVLKTIKSKVFKEWIANRRTIKDNIQYKIFDISDILTLHTIKEMSHISIVNGSMIFNTTGNFKSGSGSIIKNALKDLKFISDLNQIPIVVVTDENYFNALKSNFRDIFKPFKYEEVKKGDVIDIDGYKSVLKYTPSDKYKKLKLKYKNNI